MNLWGIIKGLLVQDETDRSKEFAIEVDPTATTGTRTTLKSVQTANREITLPDNDSELVDLDSAQILENKTMDFSTGGNNSITADAVDIIYDNTTSSLTATDTQSAIDEVEGRVDTVETDLSNHIANPTDAHDASAISFVNTTSGLTAVNVQDAIDEVEGRLDTAETDLANHIAETVDAHDASAISYDNTTSGLTATDTQDAIDEVEARLDTAESDISTNTGDISTNATNISNHISNPTGAHAASAISVVPTGNLAADDVQEALEELQTDIDGLSAGSGTMVNLGTGAGVYKEKVLDEFRLRSIKAGANITVTENADEVLIEGAASGADQQLSNLSGTTDIPIDLIFDNTLDRQVTIEDANINTNGKSLTFKAGNSGTGVNLESGNVLISTGNSTGDGSGEIDFLITQSGVSGSGVNTPKTFLNLSSTTSTSKLKLNSFSTNIYDYSIRLTNSQVYLEPSSMTGVNGIQTWIRSGNSTTNNGGDTVLYGGIASGVTGNGGNIQLWGGSSTSANGGNVLLYGGSGVSSSNKGSVEVNAKQLYLNQTPLVENVAIFPAYGVVNTTGLDTGGFGILIFQTTTAITIHGIVAGLQGQHLYIYNENNNNMTFANNSGTEPTVGNRIITCTGANFTSTGTSMHHLIYLSGRWVLQSSQV